MRIFYIVIAMLVSGNLFGQQVNEFIIDKNNRQPIKDALITSSKAAAATDSNGKFTIKVKYPKDTIHISALEYLSYQVAVLPGNPLIIIELYKQTISLKEVKIVGKRDRIKDSLTNRLMFAKSFNSAAPKFSDIVRVSKSVGPIPIAGITIIPSELLRAISYKQSKAYKFKKLLLKDEDDKYIDNRFNGDLVKTLTKLSADSLAVFLQKYRPDVKALKKMGDYDIMIYIKNNLINFKKGW